MKFSIQGKQIDIGDSLRGYVEEKINDLNEKFFNRAIDSNVIFSREGEGFFKTFISIRIGKNIQIMAEAKENEIYLSFDVAAAKLAKQLRRYKNRLRDHHERIAQTPESESLKARDYTLAMEAFVNQESKPEAEQPDNPLIVAEMAADIETLSVSEAVMRMDLANQSALLFRNAGNNGLNLVYRRNDGNVGWVDPYTENGKQAAE